MIQCALEQETRKNVKFRYDVMVDGDSIRFSEQYITENVVFMTMALQ